MTEEEKKSRRENENKWRLDFRKVQLKKMSEEERSSFRSKKVARVTAYKNSKRNTFDSISVLSLTIITKKNGDSTRIMWNRICIIFRNHDKWKITAKLVPYKCQQKQQKLNKNKNTSKGRHNKNKHYLEKRKSMR